MRTPDGEVDARVETKLDRAREVVAAALGAAEPDVSPPGRPRRDRASDAPLARRPTCTAATAASRDLIGLIVEATGLEAEVGEVCMI